MHSRAAAGREGFTFWKYPHRPDDSLAEYVRLGLGGPLLGPDDADAGLLVLDATWRYATQMEQQFEDVPVRSYRCGRRHTRDRRNCLTIPTPD